MKKKEIDLKEYRDIPSCPNDDTCEMITSFLEDKLLNTEEFYVENILHQEELFIDYQTRIYELSIKLLQEEKDSNRYFLLKKEITDLEFYKDRTFKELFTLKDELCNLIVNKFKK